MTGTSNEPIEITPQVLLKAYACGIFPMAENAHDNALYWIDPDRRGVIPLDDFHMSRRLRRVVRQARFEVRVDSALDDVIAHCAAPARGRRSTWINDRIRRLYAELHEIGHCHTVECWADGQLAGGLYGVNLGRAFFGESMFSLVTDASKVALVHLAARLKAGGFSLLDTQFVTDHLKRFGAVELSRDAYHALLEEALKGQGDFYCMASDLPPDEVLQVLSQTS